MKVTVAVVGATGYTGAEIVRLLAGHPNAEVAVVTSERQAGQPLRSSCPWLATDLVLTRFDPCGWEVDVVFLCQENGFAMHHAPSLAERSRVIDLSADFRLTDLAQYPAWYRLDHPGGLEPWPVYGLTELADRRALGQARIVANPGCYPTASLLALMPLAEAGIVAGTPVIDAKSGVSGAGRSKQETDFLFSELAGGFKPYGVTGHRHTPEIEQQLGMTVRFTPHLLPIPRGICSTIHVPVTPGVNADTVRGLWRSRYEGRTCVAVLDEGFPSTKHVLGSNRCLLAAAVDERTGYAVLVSVIDNLVKGAAGQAIQNMNLMLGLPEETGLPLAGVWP